MNPKRILFITGTRADFGKLKLLIEATQHEAALEWAVFITGMHTLKLYGYTVDEVYRSLPEHRLRDGTRSVYVFHNQVEGEPMERVLANTIDGLSRYVTEFRPDMIVVHGDRVEALAGAIVGALRNILVAHIEGGEVSGTVDELIRHAVTKMSHLHFVANEAASRRLLQLGETANSIYVVGSPDIDLMLSDRLPTLEEVKRYYNIPFEQYGIIIFHPVTTDLADTSSAAKAVVDAAIASGKKYVVIYPNNDEGSSLIFAEYERLRGTENFILIPSMRIEYFLVLLRNATLMLGNSSAGIRECPVFGVPAINVSSRQTGRATSPCIVSVGSKLAEIEAALTEIWTTGIRYEPDMQFGVGDSAGRFIAALREPALWQVSTQKLFNEVSF